jgi:hypothetical protein
VHSNKAVYLARLQFFRIIKPSLIEPLKIIVESAFWIRHFVFRKTNTKFLISDLKTAPLPHFIKIDKLRNISNLHFVFGKTNSKFVISDLETPPLLNFIQIDKLRNV